MGTALIAVALTVAGPVASIASMIIGLAFTGAAYGAIQNLTLVSAFQQVDRPQYGTASAVWNIGFDGGTALGAMLLGVIATHADFTSGVVVLAVLIMAAVPPAWRLARR